MRNKDVLTDEELESIKDSLAERYKSEWIDHTLGSFGYTKWAMHINTENLVLQISLSRQELSTNISMVAYDGSSKHVAYAGATTSVPFIRTDGYEHVSLNAADFKTLDRLVLFIKNFDHLLWSETGPHMITHQQIVTSNSVSREDYIINRTQIN